MIKYKIVKNPVYCFRLAALFFSLLITSFLWGQSNIAELNTSLKLATGDSQKLVAYESIYKSFLSSNPDSATYTLKQGLAQFTEDRYQPGIARMLTLLGGLYTTQGMQDLAKKTAEDALSICTALNDTKGIAAAHNIIGVTESRKSNFSEAMKHFFIALKIYEGLNDTDDIVNTYIKLGTVNQFNHDLDQALAYYNKGSDIIRGKPVSENTVSLESNLGSIYGMKGDYKNSSVHLLRALELSQKPEFANTRVHILTNMGNLMYATTGDTAKAMAYFRQGLEIAKARNLPENYSRTLIGIASMIGPAAPDRAFPLLNEALKIARETGNKAMESEILGNLQDVYTAKGNYKQALAMMGQQRDIDYDIFNIQNARAIENLQAMYDREKMNSRIRQLELLTQKQKQKRNVIITISVILAIGLVVVVFFLLKTRRLNQKLSERELQLQKTNAVKDKLFSIIGHDLIGAIGSMPVALHISMEEQISPEERNTLLNLLEKNATAAYETLQNLLNWGKSQMKGILLNKSDIQANVIVTDVLRLVDIAAAGKQIAVTNHIGPGTTVYADPDHFKFVVRNLLSNAIKFCERNGHVDINAKSSPDGSQVIFSIKDDGIGINLKEKANIFESFGVSKEGTDSEKGNGIGLKLCKEFVIQNGGEIWVESEKNKGSVFYFSLKAGK